jgi:gamma-glutamyltranspeptidase/glutathione hydrolase
MRGKGHVVVVLILGIWFVGSQEAAAQQKGAYGPTNPADPALNQGPKEEAIGDEYMVSTQLASSTLAAVEVLKNGGNAVDAALTALFVQQIHDYHMVFLFGSMSAIYYEAASGKYYALNAVSGRPSADRGERGDASKVAIGGTVRGSAMLSERFGSKPWASYFEPAIAAAEEGAIVTSFMYGLNFSLFEFGFLGDLRDHEEARSFYMPDGHLVGVGQRWTMPALAETLRKVASEGPDYMYTGAWGKKFVEAAQKKGYRITMEDMEEYEPTWGEPTRFTYRGHEILGSPPPDTGGLVVGYNLNILENFDLKSMGHYTKSPECLEIMARAFGRVGEETSGAIRDPLTYNVPADLWLSKEYGKMGAEFVRQTMPKVDLSPAIKESAPTEQNSQENLWSGELGSDHIVVVDGQGNWLSMLHTIHGGAPGIFIDGVRATGSGARAPVRGPGRRLVLPITAIMIAKDGKPWLAMGTPGSPPQPVTEVLVNILDFGMDPKAAAEAPRFWAFRETDTLDMETRITDDVRKGMAARGLKIKDIGDFNFHTGSMQIIWKDSETGKIHGVTDPRRLGFAAGK